MAGLTNQQKREWAQMLYCKEMLTQKEIAAKVGISEQSLTSWVKKYKWKDLQDSYTLSKDYLLADARKQLGELNNVINTREPGKRFPDSKEGDIKIKLSAEIKNLLTEVDLNDIIDVSTEFINWLKPMDFEKAREFTTLMDSFITHKLKQR